MTGFVHDVPAARVVFAAGALAQVPAEAARLGGQRVLLIGDPGAKAYADELAAALGGRLAARIDEVVMHVPVAVAEAAVARATAVAADLVVCVGGGSATGLAKAVAKQTHLPVLAVPTTYAGSEMTPIWGLTEGARKTTGRDRHVLPRTVVYDPLLTVGLPVPVSAASGMNAAAHCVEALYAPAASPVTALLAEEGLRALAAALPRVVADPSDVDARGAALYGAWLAGSVLGIAGMGVHHKVCHVLGGSYDLPHGGVHSAVLPYATAFNAPYAGAAMTRAGRALGSADPAGALWDLAAAIGAPTSLVALGFRVEEVDAAAELVAAAPPENPRQVDRAGIRDLLLAACAGHRPSAGEHQHVG
jgi:maleylacetate reductase